MKNKKIIIFLTIIILSIVLTIGIIQIKKGKSVNQVENVYETNNEIKTDEDNIIDSESSNTENFINSSENNNKDSENNNTNNNKDSENKNENSNVNITSKPTTPTQPTQPTQSTTPSQSSQPTTPTQPTQPSQSTTTTEPTQPTQPSQPTTPSQNTVPEFPTSISMLPSGDAHLSVGDTYQLNISTNPSTVANSSGTWSSSDNSVATVDSNGKVTGITNGFCKITFTSANGLTAQKQIGVYYTILGSKNFEKTVYSANGITVKANNFIYDMSATSSPFYFTVTNNSGETINAYVSTTPSYSYSNCGVKINDKNFTVKAMSSICLADNLVDSTTRKSYISIYQDYFRINQVKKINSMSFYLIICDENNHYKYSSDLIQINF